MSVEKSTAGTGARTAVDSARGWVMVAVTFVCTFVMFGTVYTFGSFFRSMADEFGTGKGATALMFSITTFAIFLFGVWTGPLADRRGPRPMLMLSGITLGVSLVATSRVGSIWVGYATYGIGVGFAVACAYVPMLANVGSWFEQKRTAALGVSVAGIGLGTLILAPLSTKLIDHYGWRTSYVILGVAAGGVLVLCSLVVARPPWIQHAAGGPDVDVRAASRTKPFRVFYVASLLMSFTLYVPFVFIKPYAEDHQISAAKAATLVGIIGASSIVGRLGLGALGARLGVVTLMQVSFGVLAGSLLIWLVAGDSLPVLTVFAVVMGVGYGGFIALSPAVAAHLFGTVGLASVLGALYTGAGVGGLIGPPIAGALIDATSYPVAIVMAAVVGFAATAVLGLLPRD